MGLDLGLELQWKYLWFISRKATTGVIDKMEGQHRGVTHSWLWLTSSDDVAKKPAAEEVSLFPCLSSSLYSATQKPKMFPCWVPPEAPVD